MGLILPSGRGHRDGHARMVGVVERHIEHIRLAGKGAGWGAYVMGSAERNRAIGEAVGAMVNEGHVRPIIGACVALEEAGDAFRIIDERRATGKVVLR